MPKIIIKVPNIKGKSASSAMVQYIASREGVDKSVNQVVMIGKPTKKQMKYINEMLKLCPDAKDTYEYQDYIENPTKQNASAFISVAAESNPQIFENRETYLSYIATRPNVEKKGSHGLFGNEDTVDLQKVKAEIENQKAVIWTPIISLRREDAARLGYDNASAWRDVIRSHQTQLADIFGIPHNEFRWYAAFHNEGHHPHLHMVVYAKDSNRGHLTEQGIEKFKSLIANDVFKNEMYELMAEKSSQRGKISDGTKNRLKEIADKIIEKDYSDSPVCDMLIDLSHKLRTVKGKKVYGYLSKPLKKDVDNIVKELAQDSDIQKLYLEWCSIQKKMVEMYNDKEVKHPPIWENDNFKMIKNAVIKEAVRLESDRIFNIDQRYSQEDEYDAETVIDDDYAEKNTAYKQSGKDVICDYRGKYGKVRKHLDDTNEFELEILREEINRNNAPAFVDMGKLYEMGIGVEQNQETANQYYKQALELYLKLESEEENPFYEYQIAKLYRREADFENLEESVKYYLKAAEKGNRYAMYTLGNVYFYGKGIETDYEKAYEWYIKSVDKGLPYACYRLGEMLRKGQGCVEDIDLSDAYFSRAITNMTWELKDENYVSHYRLGKLFERGWGIEADLDKAILYYEKASEYNYSQAEFALARIYFKQGKDEKGAEYIKRAIEHGNIYAEGWYEEYRDSQRDYYISGAISSALNLFCRLANIIDNDAEKKIDGHNKTIVDSKERKELAIKKQRLGIKMG